MGDRATVADMEAAWSSIKQLFVWGILLSVGGAIAVLTGQPKSEVVPSSSIFDSTPRVEESGSEAVFAFGLIFWGIGGILLTIGIIGIGVALGVRAGRRAT